MDELARLLADTQRPEETPRKKAEIELRHAQTNPSFPVLLTAIAAAATYPTEIRQAALSVLRNFIVTNWVGEDDEDEHPHPIPIADETKAELREKLLELATRDEEDRRVKASVRYVFQFSSLFPSILGIVDTWH
jgi:importin-9